jgi:hypothetical protein
MEIEPDTLQAGIALMDFYLTEALRLHVCGVTDPAIALAERLLEWLQRLESPYVYFGSSQNSEKIVRQAGWIGRSGLN